jgi:hypothetical protein
MHEAASPGLDPRDVTNASCGARSRRAAVVVRRAVRPRRPIGGGTPGRVDSPGCGGSRGTRGAGPIGVPRSCSTGADELRLCPAEEPSGARGRRGCAAPGRRTAGTAPTVATAASGVARAPRRAGAPGSRGRAPSGTRTARCRRRGGTRGTSRARSAPRRGRSRVRSCATRAPAAQLRRRPTSLPQEARTPRPRHGLRRPAPGAAASTVVGPCPRARAGRRRAAAARGASASRSGGRSCPPAWRCSDSATAARRCRVPDGPKRQQLALRPLDRRSSWWSRRGRARRS